MPVISKSVCRQDTHLMQDPMRLSWQRHVMPASSSDSLRTSSPRRRPTARGTWPLAKAHLKAITQYLRQVEMSFLHFQNLFCRYIRGLPLTTDPPSLELQCALGFEPQPNALHYILCTRPGPGPQCIFDNEAHLLNIDGLPGNWVCI